MKSKNQKKNAEKTEELFGKCLETFIWTTYKSPERSKDAN